MARFSFLLLFTILSSLSLHAKENLNYATLPAAIQTIQFVHQAIDYFETKGTVDALQLFSSSHGPFTQGERYIVVLNIDGYIIAHRYRPFIGRSGILVKNIDNVPIVKKALETAMQHKQGGWLTYRWYNPATGLVAAKHVYAKQHRNYVFLSGFYEDN